MGVSSLSCCKSLEGWSLFLSWKKVVVESLESPGIPSLFLEITDGNEPE